MDLVQHQDGRLGRPDWRSWNADSPDEVRLRRMVVALVALGVVVRCVRYLVCFPLWEDECFLSANFIDRGYGDLLEPCRFGQVCPVGFQFVQLTVCKLFGFHEMSLRLFAFLSGIASVFVFQRLATRLLRGTALVMAVGLFSVSYPLVRYSGEAKPYGSDLFLSVLLVWLFVEWWQGRQSTRWLWWLTAVVPFAVSLSFPVVFVAGGLSLTIACVLATDSGVRRSSAWAAWAAYNLVLIGSFLAAFLVSIRPQSQAHLATMQSDWAGAFPPLGSLAELARWLVVTHASDLLGYPLGGERGASTFTLLCCLLGLIALIRSRQWTALVLILAPFGLTFIAATLRRYPYGGHMRLNLYLAPLICLLAGAGVAAWLSRYASRPASLRRRVGVAVALLAVIGLGTIARDVLSPYKSASDMRQRAFARWFWCNAAHAGEVACAHADFPAGFGPLPADRLSLLAQHVCNREIYSARHAAGGRLNLDRVSAERPLRCVLYRDPRLALDGQACRRWLAGMTSRFELVSRQTIPVPRYDKRDRVLRFVDELVLLEFVPRGTSASEGGWNPDDRERLSQRGSD